MWHDLGDEYEKCYVPQETENIWKADILSQLENEILTAQGFDLEIAVSRYMDLLPERYDYLISLLQSKEIDTFTAIIFCETLKDISLKTKDRANSVRIRRFLDEMKVKLLNEPITVHESYTNSPYMSNYDFSDAHIIARIKAI